MNIELTPLEREAMRMLLEGGDTVLGILRDQLRASHVTQREFTGSGFYTSFSVPDIAPRISANKSFNFGDVNAEIDGLRYGAGFVLFITDGVLDYLEGYSYDEPWPRDIVNFKFSYMNENERDLGSVRAKWL